MNMDKILEIVMNFINENTTLLIIICVFLIFVLIGYLIDNSIKTRKLEKSMLQNESIGNMNPVVEVPKEPEITETPVVEEVPKEPEVTETPVVEEVPKEPETTETPVVEEVKPAIDPNTEINLDFRSEEEKEAEEVKEEPVVNEITVEPAINDLLLRDFSTEGAKTVDVEEPVKEEEKPVESVIKTDTINNSESLYKNDKKISDIFKKKTNVVKEEPVNLEKTADFNNELDRILQKLNEANKTNDSTLDETQDFTNMF